MDSLISRQATLDLAKDIIVPTKDGGVYRHRCIDPDEVKNLPSSNPTQKKDSNTLGALDCVSRQDAIDELHGKDPSQIWDTADIEVWLNTLPSVSQTINVTLDEDKVARVVEHRKKMQERKKGKENENTVYMQ